VAEAPELLVTVPSWVGDCVMAMPALRRAIDGGRWSKVGVLARPWVAPLYRLVPGVEVVVIDDAKGRHRGLKGRLTLANELRTQGWNTALLLRGAIDAAFVVWWARIPHRVGHGGEGRGVLLTRSLPLTRKQWWRGHRANHYLDLLPLLEIARPPLEPDGRPTPVRWQPDAALTQAAADLLGPATGRRVGFAPGAQFGAAKKWGAARYRAVAEALLAQGIEVHLFGSRDDQAECAAVAQGLTGVRDWSGKTDLATAIALIGAMEGFVANDSGLMHVAAAWGMPVVAIFGSTRPDSTSPLGRAEILMHPVSCAPCLQRECRVPGQPCMAAVDPDEVLAALMRALG